ncbi:MAG: SDR family oxidoreductase [Prevotellaceae bacterium]|jgi:NAD(P)-dependent dehydrogenase (short-subunit alcohol dehydrogenase family)|nr:SDR family oxidoreductase [Prevotellaceae bacterium]
MNSQFSLENKNIIITGASSGIGRQCAVLCSEAGANVTIIARNREKLEETLSLMKSGKHQIIDFDVTDFAEIDKVIDKIVGENGKINGFIHCAGMELTTPTITMKPEIYHQMYDVNVISAFEFAKHISKKKNHAESSCSLVFISSVMGILGEVAHLSYCATKGALIAGAKALALEYADKKIRFNTVSPAQIQDTEITRKMLENFSDENKTAKLAMHPLGYGQSKDVANACIYLLSDAAKWITGTNLIVDGGYSAK